MTKPILCITLFKMKNYDLSIIIPAYNCGHCIDACLDSILRQNNVEQYEIIVINDGSTDNTEQIVTQYKTQHSNITLVNQMNSGVSTARNNGINIAAGKYITFVDADDTVGISYSCVAQYLNDQNNNVYSSQYNDLHFQRVTFPEMPAFAIKYDTYYFSRMLHMADKFNADLALANKITLNYDKKYISWMGYNELKYLGSGNKSALLLYADKRENANFALYKREFLNNFKLRFETSMPLDEDILFCMLATLHAQKVVLIPHSNYLYHRHIGTASNIKNQDAAIYKYTISTIQRFSVLLQELGKTPEWQELYNIYLKEFANIGRKAPFEYSECFAKPTCLECPQKTCGDCIHNQILIKQLERNKQIFMQKQK